MANGRTATECYVLGFDPTNATNDFRIVSIELVDGKPKVVWVPKTNRWTGAEIQAVLKGAERLEGPWMEVKEEGGSPGTFALPEGTIEELLPGGAGDSDGMEVVVREGGGREVR